MIKASVIIPTYNRAEILDRCLNSLRDQGAEILVIDDGSDDETDKVARKYKTRYFYQDHKGPAVARNLAIERARNDVLIFVNDDSLVDENFVKKHLDFHQKHKKIGDGVIGPFVTDAKIEKTPVMRWLEKDSGFHFKMKDPDDEEILDWGHFWTCNLSVKKEFLINNKLWFSNSFSVPAWEDYELGYRCSLRGLRLFLAKDLKISHWHQFSFEDLQKRFFTHGRGLYCLVGRVPNLYLPLLARLRYRLLARLILGITGMKYLSSFWEKIIRRKKNNDRIYNWIMQYLVIYWKLKGFDYESGFDISRNKLDRI